MNGIKRLTLTVCAACGLCAGIAAAETLSYTTGLDVWFDASDMNGNGDNNNGWSDAEPLSTTSPSNWVNKGSAGNPTEYGIDISGAPQYRSTIPYRYDNGGGPAVEFSNDSITLPEFMDSSNVSIFAVVQRTSDGNLADPLFWDYGSSGSQSFRFALDEMQDASGLVGGWVRDADGIVLTTNSANSIATSVNIVEMILSGNTMEVGPMGVTATASSDTYDTSTTWNGTADPPTVGAHTGGRNHYFNGYIFEMLIYDHAVTGADRTAVENYLTAKYFPTITETVFRVDLQKSGSPAGQSTQAGWAAWETVTDGPASLSSNLWGIGVTITATGDSGYLTARGGSAQDRSTTITGTSWDNMVEDLWCARGGDTNMTVALTGLTPQTAYILTGWHNDSYTVLNEGFAKPLGYTITPSVTTGSLVGVADAGASSKVQNGERADTNFDTSVISFMPDETGAATIRLTSNSSSGFLVLSGLQLELQPPRGTVITIQ